MVDLTPDEPTAEERNDNQTVKVVLSPQKQAEFQNVSPKIQQNPAPQTTQDLPRVTDEGTSSGVPTLDEILAIKLQNPT